MDAFSPDRIEQTLDALLDGPDRGPPRLADAIRHAVFPGGQRVRPRLCLAVAQSCATQSSATQSCATRSCATRSRGAGPDPALALRAAAAIEFLHCASLVHDDLPCFDDSPLRRGRPSVHAVFGSALAVLAGDALIVLAFEAVAAAPADPARLVPLLRRLARAAGSPAGLVAGQGWEAERTVKLAAYHRAKTASLFTLATALGAAVAGDADERWEALGLRLGEAYQIADDLRDATLEAGALGKPAGRDAALGRPSALATMSGRETLRRVETLVRAAVAAIPPCDGADALRALIRAEMDRLLPPELVLRLAA